MVPLVLYYLLSSQSITICLLSTSPLKIRLILSLETRRKAWAKGKDFGVISCHCFNYHFSGDVSQINIYSQDFSLKLQIYAFNCLICLHFHDPLPSDLIGPKLSPNLLLLCPRLTEQNAAAAAKSRQACPTLCDPIDGSPTGSSVPGILQARVLEWVAISFSNAWKWKVKMKLLSRVLLLVTPWTAANQAPPSMGFSRQEYWSGLPLPSLD